MEKAKISVIQLFALMFIFNLGTALIVSYGITAKKDAWFSILLGMGGGIFLFFIYYLLFRQYPNLPFTACIRKIVGKYIGWGLGLIYCLLFLYIAARNIRDFGDLLLSSTLPRTPLLAINLTLVLVICYIIHLGIEVIGRTGEVFIVILLLLGIAANFFVLVSGDIDFEQVRPFLEHGWRPILTTTVSFTMIFPFGEMLVFTMLLPYLNRPELVKRVWVLSVISSGLVLSWTAVLNMAALGINVMERSTFPTLATIGKVNLLNFIERLDAIVVFTLLMTVFFKASVLLYGAMIGIVDLFKLESHKPIILPIGIVAIFLSMTIASSFSEHMEEGLDVVLKYLSMPLLIILPLVLFLISMIRNILKRKAN
ncbi:GerAB/ArcD/ProY family transporter [Priestia endophytica]|uniref:GerAB/ArcD/ProY family transporter n=1 Tax=Priestia endophytica TaxID=135735 RepID=UPI00227F012E|nr:GerAB/ArcD/ProY family transporter [Priestia endophytica]MCY8231157.1 spore germination protein [Priestia endophytica]